MRILLDTHIFLWYIEGNTRLPIAFREAIRDPDNVVCLSVASVWECVVKNTLGKLPLPESPEQFLPRQRQAHRIESLPIEEGTLIHLADLPNLHRDPFDRIIVAQSIQHGLLLATVDLAVQAYPVSQLGKS